MNVPDVTQYALGNDGLESRDRWTLVALAWLADEQGRVELTTEELCLAVGITAPTLRRSLKALEGAGLVRTVGRTAETGICIRQIDLEEIV